MSLRASFSTVTALLFLALTASANPVTLDTLTYNFPLTGGGGGSSGVIDHTENVELFCVDFANDIHVPHSGYSAWLSTLTTGSDLTHTRFGGNTSWTTITISDGDSNDTTDSGIINAAGALGRYQMAAFLVTQYQQGQGSNAYNNGIQGAIWDLLDPKSSPAAPNFADANAALELAAEWYSNPSSDKSFLANFRIVSDTTMNWNGTGNPLTCGFQEQLTMVPEPRQAVWVLGGLLAALALFRLIRKQAETEAPAKKY